MNINEASRVLLEIGLGLMIQSALLIGIALLAARGIGRRGPAAQALVLRSATVAVLLCALVSVGLAGHIHPFISISLPMAASQPASSSAHVSETAAAGAVVGNDNAPVEAGGPADLPTTAAPPAQVPAVTTRPSAPPASPVSISRLPAIWRYRTWLYPVLACVWVVGIALLAGWLLLCQCHLMLILRRGKCVDQGTAHEALERLSGNHGQRKPMLVASRSAQSPFLAGLWRPTIFLPAEYTERFDQQAILAVISHEMCHLRRGDPFWSLLVRLMRILLWPQPLAWLLERRLHEACEAICDAEVVGQGQVSASLYAGYLVSMAEHLALSPTVRAVGLGVVPFRSSIGKRVHAVLFGSPTLHRPITPAARWTIIAGAVALVVMGAFLVAGRVSSATASSGESPVSVVQEYLDDLSNGQTAQAYALFSPATRQAIPLESFLSTSLDLVYSVPKGHMDSVPSIMGLFHDPHTLFFYRFEVIGPSTDDPNVVQVRVYPPGITLKNSFTLGVVTVPDPAEGNVPRMDFDKTLALIDPNAPQEVAAKAKSVECINHLRQLALSTLEYLQDHNEVFPDASRWTEEIRPYMKDKSVFQDPLDPQGGPWGFAFNRNLSHVNLAQLEEPSRTVLFFESTANRENASDTGQSIPKPGRMDNGGFYALADGHVKLFPDSAALSFSITPERASVTIQDLYDDLNPGQQKVYLQIKDPNSTYQTTSFGVPPGSPYLGIQYAPAGNFKGNPLIAHLPGEVLKTGMVVVGVVPDGPAASAGIQRTEIILEADGQSLNGNQSQLRQIIERHKIGERMSLVVYSHGVSRQVLVTVGKAPALQKQVAEPGHIPVTVYEPSYDGKPARGWVELQPDTGASATQDADSDWEQAERQQSLATTSQIKQVRRQLYVLMQDLRIEKHSPTKENQVRQEIVALQAELNALETEQAGLSRLIRKGGPMPEPEIWSSPSHR